MGLIADIVADPFARSNGAWSKVARKDDQAKGTAKHLEYATVFGSHLQQTHSYYSWTQEIVLQPDSGSNRISGGLSSVPAAQSLPLVLHKPEISCAVLRTTRMSHGYL